MCPSWLAYLVYVGIPRKAEVPSTLTLRVDVKDPTEDEKHSGSDQILILLPSELGGVNQSNSRECPDHRVAHSVVHSGASQNAVLFILIWCLVCYFSTWLEHASLHLFVRLLFRLLLDYYVSLVAVVVWGVES